MSAKLIINEQHNMFPEQKEIIEKKFGANYEIIKIPSNGINLNEIKKLAKRLYENIEKDEIVLISPIPALMLELSKLNILDCRNANKCEKLINLEEIHPFWIFHNDVRNKKELPNGKIISVVSDIGWKLI